MKAPSTGHDAPRPHSRGLKETGIGFLVLGLAVMVVPIFATTALVVLLGIMMMLWGIFGMAMTMSLSGRALGLTTLGFLLVASIGLAFVVRPGLGAETLTLIAVAALLMEGIHAILLGLSLKEHDVAWLGVFASGTVGLVVGFLILLGWPDTASWILGLGLGVNFATTGLALLLLDRSRKLRPR